MTNINRSTGLAGLAVILLLTQADSQAQPPNRQADRQQDRQHDRRQERQAYPAQSRSVKQSRQWQKQRGWQQQGDGWQGQQSWGQHRAQTWQVQRRTWVQRGGYGGYYIPQDRFFLRFGSRNVFRLGSRPIIVGGFPRFRYQGYQFMMVDPWPESWAEDWYANDDVYVDYDDGYYLHNRRDPGVQIAITIVR